MAPAPSAGKTLAGFLLSGFLFALLGAVLPAWGYHRDPPEFITIGNCFLCLAVGVIAAHQISAAILARKNLRFLLVFACGLGCAGLLSLAVATPPVEWPWRMPGLAALGLAVGLLNAGLFQAIATCYWRDPVRVAAMAGIYYGLGSLAVTLLVAGTFYAYTVPVILILMTLTPALFGVLYARMAADGKAAVRRQPISARLCAISAAWAPCCSPCCCSFNSAMSGRSPDGCRCFWCGAWA